MTARILIVDDMPANTRLLEAKLAAEYYQVSSARDGFEALATARAWQPDLILLDVMMPGMDGYECCRQLKDDAVTLHIPVVMVTALGEPGERLRGLEAGADDFLTKPVDYDTLMARVRSLVRLKRLLDEWRARGDTARALGLSTDRVLIPSIAGARALVIDDWGQNAQGIQDALAEDGVISACAHGVTEAIRMTAAANFDLLVVNLSLANEDPLKLVSILRASDATHETPLLLVGEPGEKDRILRGFELGANDWLIQPIDPHELRARARNQVRRKFYQDRLRSDLGTALEMALTDPLTGLYNQRYLRRHLGGLMESGQGRQLAVLMVDVDHFKLVNDRYGHASGDRALRLIADSLRINTRVFDSVARYGGEEFIIVMPGTAPAEAAAAAERLRHAVEEIKFNATMGIYIQLTVSVGVACTPVATGSPEALLQAADAALYDAKRNGRNRVEMARTADAI
ncbi:MAG: two-component system, cell cycle response regulator [Acetobacteraceae bacterium]|jgi:two-component system cell cycle response regulator|nr:PleD family two-component system response regulator [Rhodopila sp.]MEA2729563.1 two-component system, cell cycle response regulator [Acetobacteraceae bacterium]MEA2772889.1 two-component system, cell cycle response regulator [Acetobacteraceae bacterium]